MAGNRRFALLRNRIVRIVVPVATVAVLASGVAVAAWPDKPTETADPRAATNSSPAAAPATTSVRSSNGTSRDRSRPDLSTGASSTTPNADVSTSATPTRRPTKKPTHKPTKKPTHKPTMKPTHKPTHRPKAVVVGSRYTTVDLNVRRGPSGSSKVLTVLDPGSKVKITDNTDNGFREVLYDQRHVWVSADYLSKKKPKPEERSGGISTGPCKDGSAVESGLTQDAIRVHRAICAQFPQVTAYGGVRSADGGYHSTGQALDIMVSEPAGWQIARWVRANATALGASEVIHAQHIWTVQRSSEGWRSMPDRGSATANHYDHVHVSVYGNSGTA